MKKNFITVIDTEKDLVEKYIPYDNNIEDIAFCDNNMLVSAWAPKGKPYQIDVINLDNYFTVKTIPLDFKMTSMVVIGKIIYGINGLSKEPVLYMIDWESGQIIDKIELKEYFPWKVYINKVNGDPFIYVTHYDIDDMSGDSITCIDPVTNKIVSTITCALHPEEIAFNNDEIVVGDSVNDRLLIIKDNKIIHEIKLDRRAMSIVKTDSYSD
ncbi:MAG: hypothetical protein A4E55_01204 [Pelotomaculum sp. PtaU1.Bin035]|nr:MAG: hypothetical protein A4E55_01204 [Pelotomaculum sp. PtaU1.Bin035]